MSKAEDHERLLDALQNHKGPVIISGYDNSLYDSRLQGWHKEYKNGRANNASVRTETIWMNFDYQLRFDI